MSRKKLSRRTFLRGAGAAVALPVLDAMRPTTALAQSADVPSPRRFIAFYVPNGIHMADWTPGQAGSAYELPPILEPLAPVRDQVLVLSGLRNLPARPDGPGDHAAGTGSFLTATHVFKTQGENIRNDISLDQVLAGHIGAETPFPSLELGAEGGGSTGNCDSGYSCAYSRNISWAGPQTPMHKEVNPRSVFNRLFAGQDPAATIAARVRRKAHRLSVLDFVMEDIGGLKQRLGRGDNQKLDEYLTGVRALEQRIESTEDEAVCDSGPAPVSSGDLPRRIEQMADLMALAFRCDLTRVITFMLGNAGSNRVHRFLGINEGHHAISHHQRRPENYRDLSAIGRWEVSELAYLLQALRNSPEGDHTLLDQSLVFFSSEIEDGNTHAHVNLPVLLCGGAGGAIRTGRHHRYSGPRDMSRLFISIADVYGLELDTFGDDGTSPIDGLT